MKYEGGNPPKKILELFKKTIDKRYYAMYNIV